MKTYKLLILLSVLVCHFKIQGQPIAPYVPTNGLVGWYPFSGNANDESGNGNHGIIFNAISANDRLNSPGQAYSFDGLSSKITLPNTNNFPIGNSARSFSVWFKMTMPPSNPIYSSIIRMGNNTIGQRIGLCYGNNTLYVEFVNSTVSTAFTPDNNWHHFVVTYPMNGVGSNSILIYLDSNLLTGYSINQPINILNTSANISNGLTYCIGTLYDLPGYYWDGELDDIGIWNRALTQQEVTALYNGCSNSITTQPQNQVVANGGSASFSTSSSDPNTTYQWQSDLGFGWQNLTNAGQYGGVTTSILSVSNITAANNNQAFRCIITSGCVDTSATAYLTLSTGLADLASNEFSLYPNPASEVIKMNFKNATEKTIQLIDQTGRIVIEQKSSTLKTEIAVADLAKGIYTVRVGSLNKMVVIH